MAVMFSTFLGENLGNIDQNNPQAVLKRMIQILIEKELAELLVSYGFVVSRVVVQQEDNSFAFRLGMEVVYTSTQERLQCSQIIDRMSFERGYRYNIGTESMFCSEPFVSAIYHLVRTVRGKIEDFVKDKPMVYNHYTASQQAAYWSNQITNGTLSVADIRYVNNLPQLYATSTMTTEQARSLPKSAFTNCLGEPVRKTKKKKSKFSFIDQLISEAKERLVSDYVKPEFVFEYF